MQSSWTLKYIGRSGRSCPICLGLVILLIPFPDYPLNCVAVVIIEQFSVALVSGIEETKYSSVLCWKYMHRFMDILPAYTSYTTFRPHWSKGCSSSILQRGEGVEWGKWNGSSLWLWKMLKDRQTKKQGGNSRKCLCWKSRFKLGL